MGLIMPSVSPKKYSKNRKLPKSTQNVVELAAKILKLPQLNHKFNCWYSAKNGLEKIAENHEMLEQLIISDL